MLNLEKILENAIGEKNKEKMNLEKAKKSISHQIRKF